MSRHRRNGGDRPARARRVVEYPSAQAIGPVFTGDSRFLSPISAALNAGYERAMTEETA